MTKAAQAFGKRVDNFLPNAEAVEYIGALAALVPEIPVISVQRGNGLLPSVGTWGHPKLVVFFARWLSPKFAVFCDAAIDDILNRRAELVITKPEESAALSLADLLDPRNAGKLVQAIGNYAQLHLVDSQKIEEPQQLPTRHSVHMRFLSGSTFFCHTNIF